MDKIKTNKQTKKLIKTLFPEYKGRVTYLTISEEYSYNSVNTFWSGGYKTSIRVVENNNGKTSVKAPSELDKRGIILNPITMNHESFKVPLGDNRFIIEHQFAGTKQWIHIYSSQIQSKELKQPLLLK